MNNQNFDPNQQNNQAGFQPQNQQQFAPNYYPPANPYTARNPKDGRGLSIAALVLGICGVVFCWVGVLNIIILVCGILGIVFGVIGRKKSIICYGKPSGMATAGLALGIIGTAICAIGVIACVACVGCSANIGGCTGCLSAYL